jgi:hypothetical protein
VPNVTDYKVSIPLTNFSIGYQNSNLIGESLFPTINRSSRFGTYWVYGKEAFTPENDRRAPGTRAQEVEHSFTSATYVAEEHALIEPVTWEERDEAAKNGFPTDPYQDATDLVSAKIALRRELDIANLLRSTATITQNTTLSGTAQWSGTTTASVPYDNIMTGHDTIRAQIGRRANTLVLPYAVRNQVRKNPQLQGLVSANDPKLLSDGELADIFEVDRILIPEAIYNTAITGQTATMADIWGKDALLMYVTDTPRVKDITTGILIRVNYGRFAGQVRTWTELDRKSDFVEAAYTEIPVVVAPQAAYLIKTAVA